MGSNIDGAAEDKSPPLNLNRQTHEDKSKRVIHVDKDDSVSVASGNIDDMEFSFGEEKPLSPADFDSDGSDL